MPELPDVENYNRYVKRHALRKTITGVQIGDRRVLARTSPRGLHDRLVGSRFVGTRRHGKQLFVRSSKGGWLTLHFGMTGSPAAYKRDADAPRYVRAQFDFGNGEHLAFVDPRLFGKVGYVDDADSFIAKQHLGPDALDPHLTFARFKDALGSGGGLKAALMDQSRLAGIGNIFADEILYQARLHPLAAIGTLKPQQLRRLYQAMRRVLKMAIARGAGAEHFAERLPSGYLLRHRDKGGTCPRGHGPLKTIKAAGRTTYFCPRCQPR